MKIKKIEFCNINSLAHEWTIDFESPDFAKSGMFCISGPTGSGKTSILDAICLGLYGKTPRLGAIVGESNEVMTYGAKNCYAKVFFECGNTIYSARWEQHRSARTNKLQKYSWVLTNETAQTVECSFSKQSEIEATMTRVIGLDFGQFTKSMMLAQGEFNKFLKCNENERAAILEKLTGDGIYRKIAVAVHDLYASADKAVEDVERKMGDVSLLSEEELTDLNTKISAAELQKQTLAKDAERLLYICTWFENLHGFEKLLSDAKIQLENAECAKAEFEPNRNKLERALRAQEVESSFVEFNSVRENLARVESQLVENKGKLPAAVSDLEQASVKNREAQAAFEKCKADYSANEKVWEQVSSLDVDIRNARGQLQNANDSVAKSVAESEDAQKKISEADKRISDNEQALEKVTKYIAENSKDELIDGQISLLKSQIAEWKSESENVSDEIQKLENLKKSLQNFDTDFEKQKRELQILQEYLTEHQGDAELVNILPEMNRLADDAERQRKELERLQGEIDAKQKQLDNVKAESAQSFEKISSLQKEKERIIQDDIPVVVAELRHHLKSGEPCPVCGSREHVSCENAEKVENEADRLNDFADKLRKINGEMEQVQRALDGFATQQKYFEEVLDECLRKKNESADEEARSLEQLNVKLEPWKLSASIETAREILQKVSELKNVYLQKKEKFESLQNEVNQAAVNRANIVSEANAVEESLKKSQSKLQKISQDVETAFAEWFSNVRMEDIDTLVAELEKKNSWWKKAQEKKVKVENDLNMDHSAKVQHQDNFARAKVRLEEASAKQNEIQQNLNTLDAKRKEIFGEKSVEVERNKARTLRESAEALASESLRKEQQMREAKIALDNSIVELERRIADAKQKLAQTQTLFLENLSSKSFADEQEFIAAKLPEAERKSLQQIQKNVEDNLTTAQTSVKNFNDQLAKHLEKRNFEESEDLAKHNSESAKAKLNECTVNLATWAAQKENDAQLRQKFNDMQAELAKLKSKRADWEQMQRWFNGNRLDTGNGDVFVRFIQTITLRNLLKIANSYLRDMFPRYEMITEPNTLNIQLVDHDNSDAVRPIDNISGGEGFLVSLSLALGISTLASRNVRIDSMFLDEGFGTLDSKMLQETVIVLQKMQQEKGKLLGVITHVDLVKSELPTHIEVTPCGGRSVLSGAGVKC
ncbi:AAA family ATPase [Fibrobacter sp. UWB12]|uniref:AAA family ATPase n=1 Tax=Fibrobacter sp. UWB12 TaxID=1896203 RepID=UPI0009200FE1|nr:AAA family ATPase [Fibrobacter sp. UWB12]SHK78794.1 exonuclease SbcC [Fibrobacter sp. UWB12]